MPLPLYGPKDTLPSQMISYGCRSGAEEDTREMWKRRRRDEESRKMGRDDSEKSEHRPD